MADAEEGGGGGERLDSRLEALCQYCLRTLKVRQLFIPHVSWLLPRLYISATTQFLIFVHLGEAYKKSLGQEGGGSLEVFSSVGLQFRSSPPSLRLGIVNWPLIIICKSGQCTLEYSVRM